MERRGNDAPNSQRQIDNYWKLGICLLKKWGDSHRPSSMALTPSYTLAAPGELLKLVRLKPQFRSSESGSLGWDLDSGFEKGLMCY